MDKNMAAAAVTLHFVALSTVDMAGHIEFHDVDVPVSTSAARRAATDDDNGQKKSGGRTVIGQTVCLLLLPSFMIPGDILRYFTPRYLDRLLRMSVFRHATSDDYLAILEMESEDAAKELIGDFGGRPLSSLDQVTCVLYSVKAVHWSSLSAPGGATAAASSAAAAANLSVSPLPLLDICDDGSGSGSGKQRRPLLDAVDTSLRSTTPTLLRGRTLSLSQFHHPSPSQHSAADSFGRRSHTFDDTTLAADDAGFVSLAQQLHAHAHPHGHTYPAARCSPLSAVVEDVLLAQRGASVSTSAAAHDAVLDSAPDLLCPLCLDPIDPRRPRSFATACRHTFHVDCIRLLEVPQCPVCRFQHDSTAESLSVCFECGWNGLAQHTSAATSASATAADASTSSSYPSSLQPQPEDLWVCLVCGFVGCGRRHRAHIHAHYEQHLHAYAMNTDDRRVWDFAGDGWVHRLILQKADADPGGAAFAPASAAVPLASASAAATADGAGVSVKMVEVSDPRHRHPSRPHVPPLSAEEEEEIVSRKLESAARHYNQLVAWQLQHNREQHEIRLQRLRAFIQQETSVVAGGSGPGQHSADPGQGTNWTTALLQLAATEKAKLLRQTDAARARLAAVREEAAMLRDLNGSLQQNTAEWQRRADAAQARLAEAQAMHQRFVGKLEERVAALMEKLDAAPPQAPPSSSLPSVMK